MLFTLYSRTDGAENISGTYRVTHRSESELEVTRMDGDPLVPGTASGRTLLTLNRSAEKAGPEPERNEFDEAYKKDHHPHSNDMHGDFLAEQLDNKLVGGVSMLSGYVEKGAPRREKCSSMPLRGDMFRGSVIDSE